MCLPFCCWFGFSASALNRISTACADIGSADGSKCHITFNKFHNSDIDTHWLTAPYILHVCAKRFRIVNVNRKVPVLSTEKPMIRWSKKEQQQKSIKLTQIQLNVRPVVWYFCSRLHCLQRFAMRTLYRTLILYTKLCRWTLSTQHLCKQDFCRTAALHRFSPFQSFTLHNPW